MSKCTLSVGPYLLFADVRIDGSLWSCMAITIYLIYTKLLPVICYTSRFTPVVTAVSNTCCWHGAVHEQCD